MKLNKFVKFPLVLGIVGTICAGALGVVYEITNPIIQDRINKEANAAIMELLPDMDSANDLTTTFEKDTLKEYNVSSVKEVIDNNETIAYAYQATGKGYAGDMNFLIILSSNENKILGFKVISHNETNSGSYGGPLLNSPEFATQFVGISFDDVSSKVDFVAGSTAGITLNGIKGAVNEVIEFHKFQVLGEEDTGIELTSAEMQLLNLPAGQTMVDKTDEFLAKLGNNADKAKDTMDLLNYVEIVDANNAVVGHAYITETTYIIFEGLKQKHKLVFMFDANWENSKLVAVSSTDTMGSAPDYADRVDLPTIVGHPFLNQYNNKSMSDFVSEYLANSDIIVDMVHGASVTTTQVKNNIVAIVRYHNQANK